MSMDKELNATYLTFGGHVEIEKYRYLYFMIMFTAYILIVFSNSMIVYIICTHQNLHEPMYIFIAALLINSVLYSTLIYPKLLFDFLSEKRIISFSACLLQFHFFYCLAGSEYLLLAAMAYDRYVSICKPLQYPNIMKKTTVCIFLTVAWLMPVSQVAVATVQTAKEKLCSFILKGVFCNNAIYKLQCEISRERFIRDWILMFNLIFLPMFFILFTYTRIFIISYQSSKEVRKKAAQTCLPHLIVMINLSLLGMYDVLVVGLESDMPKTVSLIMTLQIILYHPLFNPIMYGLKMKEISKHLKKLFCSIKMN